MPRGHVAGLGPEWVGLSVTMPGKEEALALADEHQARMIGIGTHGERPLMGVVLGFGTLWDAMSLLQGVIGRIKIGRVQRLRQCLARHAATEEPSRCDALFRPQKPFS